MHFYVRPRFDIRGTWRAVLAGRRDANGQEEGEEERKGVSKRRKKKITCERQHSSRNVLCGVPDEDPPQFDEIKPIGVAPFNVVYKSRPKYQHAAEK